MNNIRWMRLKTFGLGLSVSLVLFFRFFFPIARIYQVKYTTTGSLETKKQGEGMWKEKKREHKQLNISRPRSFGRSLIKRDMTQHIHSNVRAPSNWKSIPRSSKVCTSIEISAGKKSSQGSQCNFAGGIFCIHWKIFVDLGLGGSDWHKLCHYSDRRPLTTLKRQGRDTNIKWARPKQYPQESISDS